ncbi:exo-alpha-sialidase [Vibrio aquaticus]|uniref:exo-alpha-sialidase n=1 Tax=Vibrio aquaticus TaxID=2496559 RepID=A0A432D268_9VIBR|nr:sialidase family protein [Vibrio aquaticus]RTZ18030.1 exo-alpha-sialidase [Vibrio aquaticus]
MKILLHPLVISLFFAGPVLADSPPESLQVNDPNLRLDAIESQELYVPVESGRYRTSSNLSVFSSGNPDQYRLPSMVAIGNDEVLFFAERRPIGVGDFRKQDIVMRKLNRETGYLEAGRVILHNQDFTHKNYLSSLMNPTTIFDEATNTVHLFFNSVFHTLTNDIKKVQAYHVTSSDGGTTWSEPAMISEAMGECETSWVGPGRAVIVNGQELTSSSRIIVPMRTGHLESEKSNSCSEVDKVAKGGFYSILTEDGGQSWSRAYNTITTGSDKATFGEAQIIYHRNNDTTYMISRIADGSAYGFDGSGLAYSLDAGSSWNIGFYPNAPYKDNVKVGLTGRFVTPTQSGLSSDGENLYYTTSVSWETAENDEKLHHRKEAWIHKFNPNDMLSETDSPVVQVQPITKSGFGNVSTQYLGNNRIGILWEEIKTWQVDKRIWSIFYTELDTRDFRPILDPAWVENGFTYHPTKNGSHHLLNPEINEGDKSGDWNPQ